MTEPSSPATAELLRGPNADALELERREADAARIASDVEAARADVEARAAEAARAADHARKREQSKAPIGFFRSMRFFWLALSAVSIGVVALVVEDVRVAFAFAAWFVVFGALFVDARTWRRRLPFVVDGYDTIHGEDHSDRNHGTWLRVQLTIKLATTSSDALAARKSACAVLVACMNAGLAADKSLDDDDRKKQAWRMTNDGCVGGASLALFITRQLERWLRNEATLCARVGGVDRVVVDARYTQDRFWVSSS